MHYNYRNGSELSVSSNGELIWPAQPLNAFSLRDTRTKNAIDLNWLKKHWTLVYLAGDDCGDRCGQTIYHMRQIHIALGKEAHRVQRLVVAHDTSSIEAFIDTQYPSLNLVSGDADNLLGLSSQFETAVRNMPVRKDSLYLIDPLGNLMMRFPIDTNPKGILKDIKRALRASRIG